MQLKRKRLRKQYPILQMRQSSSRMLTQRKLLVIICIQFFLQKEVSQFLIWLLKAEPGSCRGSSTTQRQGTQYCSFEYVLELREADITISMTEDGEGYERGLLKE